MPISSEAGSITRNVTGMPPSRTSTAPMNCLRAISHRSIWLVRARTGEKAAADKELADYLTKHRQKIHSDYGEWETRIADFLLDKIQETDLFKPPFNSKNGYFFSYYIGMKRLLSGDKSGAVESFMKGSAPIETGQPEYLFTAAELKSLGQQTAEK
jgi:lipoprotein NlpI